MSIKQKSIFCTFIITVFLTAISVFAHEWTATSGHKLSGEFIKLENGIVFIKLSDDKIAEVPLDKLCDSDKEFVSQETAKKENPFVIMDEKKSATQDNKETDKQSKQIEEIDKVEKQTESQIETKQDNTSEISKQPNNNHTIDWRTPIADLQAEADKGNPEAMCWLGFLLERSGKLKNIKKARELFNKAAQSADKENAAVIFCSGKKIWYDFSEKVMQDEKLKNDESLWRKKSTEKWDQTMMKYKEAAEKGFIPAQVELANSYYSFDENVRNTLGNKLEQWLNAAVKQNCIPAFSALSNMYYYKWNNYYNDPNKENYLKESYKLCCKAAEQGDAQSQYELATSFLLRGCGEIEKDEQKAIEWLKKSFEQEYSPAISLLVFLFYDRKDTVETMKWLRKGLELEDTMCISKFADMYLKNEIPESDGEEVIKWLKLGIDNGNEYLNKQLLEVERKALLPTKLPFVEIRHVGQFSEHAPRGTVSEFSLDCKYVGTYANEGSKELSTIWETQTGKKVYELSGGSPIFSPDGKYIATFYQSWDTREYQQRFNKWKRANPQDARRGIVPMSYTWLKIWDAKTGKEIRQMQEIDNSRIAFSDDGKSYMIDGYLWNTATGKKERKLNANELENILKTKKPQTEHKFDAEHSETTILYPNSKFKLIMDSKNHCVILCKSNSDTPLIKIENATDPYLSPNEQFLIHSIPKGDYGKSNIMRIYDLQSITGAININEKPILTESNFDQYNQKAENGDAQAQLELGKLYLQKKEFEQTVKWYRKSAEQGNAEGQWRLGSCYFNGEGVKEDKVEGVKLFRKSAEQGNADGQWSLGNCYFWGDGVKENKVEAVKWFRKSSEQGNAKGQFLLGNCYFHGDGVKEDKVEAVKLLRKSAEQGDADGQWSFGNCYFWGDGVKENKEEAVKWFRKSAEQGNAEGQWRLGVCYVNGNGVKEDKMEGVKWLRKSAEQGNAEGQGLLGACYFYGEGVKEDKVEGVKLLRKSAEQGYELAIELLKELQK